MPRRLVVSNMPHRCESLAESPSGRLATFQQCNYNIYTLQHQESTLRIREHRRYQLCHHPAPSFSSPWRTINPPTPSLPRHPLHLLDPLPRSVETRETRTRLRFSPPLPQPREAAAERASMGALLPSQLLPSTSSCCPRHGLEPHGQAVDPRATTQSPQKSCWFQVRRRLERTPLPPSLHPSLPSSNPWTVPTIRPSHSFPPTPLQPLPAPPSRHLSPICCTWSHTGAHPTCQGTPQHAPSPSL